MEGDGPARFASEDAAKDAEKFYGFGSHIESEYRECLMCDGKLAHHAIPESSTGSEVLNYVYYVMRDNDKISDPETNAEIVPKMVGIMKTNRGWFAANSGANNGLLCDYVLSFAKPHIGEVRWIRNSSMNESNARTAGGARIPSGYVRDCHYKNIPFSCAAPKLVSFALANGLEILEMSEIWFGASKAGGMSIWSCETCKPLLQMLLCPVKH